MILGTAYLPLTTGTVGYYFKSVRWSFENDPGGNIGIDIWFPGNQFPYTILPAIIASQKTGTAQIDFPPTYSSGIQVNLYSAGGSVTRTGRTIVNIGYF